MSLRSAFIIACRLALVSLLVLVNPAEASVTGRSQKDASSAGRERTSLNSGWRFKRWTTNPDNLMYDTRADTAADARALKTWILPSANEFINNASEQYKRPTGSPPGDVPFVQTTYDDSTWETVNLPHDWAIKGPFYTAEDAVVGGGMGRLPIQGIAWYRRNLVLDAADANRKVYLDIDGAMSYAMVWLNGNLVGGWPYGYTSFRLDLTPYIKPGKTNQLAIRLDNPVESSRWYPGGGVYRNVWLVKVDRIHVGQWGTHVISKDVSTQSATVELSVQVDNQGDRQQVNVATDLHLFDPVTGKAGAKVAEFTQQTVTVAAGQKQQVNGSITVNNPKLWGPPPTQEPNLYVAVTRILSADKQTLDTYETRFGIRSFSFTGDQGLLVNGEHVYLQGVNQHHDLGALGAAFNNRAAQRHLEILQELGSNAIRMSHNPPAPELLDLTDQMGILVMDEAFDCWRMQKNPNDYHLLFDDWSEPDLRAMLRRDRNHPSIFVWSIGNEVGEQSTDANGTAIGQRLSDIVHQEDPTRLSTASMNQAKPNQTFPEPLGVISLNYQGEGIRDSGAYANFSGTRTPPMYPDFHAAFPEKMILSSETAAALSTRGTYFFPVTEEFSAPQTDLAGGGGNPELCQVSAYELYTSPFGASPDKVFQKQDENPFVAGEFVWAGWDYLGEPTPYYTARSSYYGIIDLCGFKKDRFHLYQARWRPDLKTAHILPHWNWPDRVGEVTPVHVFSAGDEAELFLNGKSQGRIGKTPAASNYRFRWDSITYEAGELHVVTYKDGQEWANATVRTTGAASRLRLTADRSAIQADGYDLSFVTLEVLDADGNVVPQADNSITFTVSGAGELVATDNGDPYDMVAFPSKDRKAFSGLAMAIVRAKAGKAGAITVKATGSGLTGAEIKVVAR